MPVRLDSRRTSRDRKANAAWPPPGQPMPPADRSQCVTIGLVNNMPEAAFHATERQFISLLNAASEDIPIYLSLHVLPSTTRSAPSVSREGRGYSSVETLWDTHLDGLIVTGRESQKPNLKDESYWDHFTSLVDWAQTNTYSAVWSCLAAHAAVLHMDGIGRRRNPEKYSGVFECITDTDHWLTAGSPQRHPIPHSRWHGVSEDALAPHGYRVLIRTRDAEPDMFIKHDRSLFIFFQGHPEYETDTLLREYRRDVGRYLRRDETTYPSIPRSYFDSSTEAALERLRDRASSLRGADFLSELANSLDTVAIENTWQSPATHIYRNWLQYLYACKKAGHPSGNTNVAHPVSS